MYRETIAREEMMESSDDNTSRQNAPDHVAPALDSGNEDSNEEMKDPPDSGGDTPRQSSDEEMMHSSAVKKGTRKDGPWEESESEEYQPLSDGNEGDKDDEEV